MKFLLDRKEIQEDCFIYDWENDDRIQLLKDKYKFKKTILRDKDGIDSEINTIRIRDIRQLDEFKKDMNIKEITIVDDPGYYFDIGCKRILI